MSHNAKLLPCPFCGGKANTHCTEGDYPDWHAECGECGARADIQGPYALEWWNRRAAQPVAVEGLSWEAAFEMWWENHGQYCRAGGGQYEKTFAYRAWEAASVGQPVAVEGMPERLAIFWGDQEVRPRPDGEYVRYDAFTAWLSKAAQGLPARKSHHLHESFLSERDKGINETLDAVQPLVAQLRAELATMTKYRDNAANHMSRIRSEATAFQKERDALRAENERLRDCIKANALAAGELVAGVNLEAATLRTANAELVGLLRRIIPSLNAVHDFDLISEIYALLASAGGGE